MCRLIFVILAVLCCVFLAELPCIAASPSSKEADALYNELLKDKSYKEADGKMAAAYTKLMRGLDAEGQQKLRQEQRDWIRRRDTLLHDSPRPNLVSLAVAETERRQGELEPKPTESGRLSEDTKSPKPQATVVQSLTQKEPATEGDSLHENTYAGAQMLAQIESLIDDGRYMEAKHMASELGRLATGAMRTRAQADANYCLGVIAFLSGGDDVNAEQYLEKALNLYQQESILDETGLVRTLFFIETIYLELKKNKLDPDKIQNLVNKSICGSKEIGLLKTTIEYDLREIEKLNFILNLKDVIDRQKEVIKEHYRSGGIGDKDRLYLSELSKEQSQLPRIERRQKGLENLNKVHKEWKSRCVKLFADRVMILDAIIEAAKKSKLESRSELLGFGVNGKPWKYHFLENDAGGLLSLEHNRPEKMIFQSSEYVVTESSEMEFSGVDHYVVSRLLFYDARTLRHITTVSVPNSINEIGKFPDTPVFFVITQNYRKDHYVDAPLVLSFLNLKTKQIDRALISPPDDTGDSRPHIDMSVSVLPNKLVIQCNSDINYYKDYTIRSFTNSSFKYIKTEFKFSPNSTSSVNVPLTLQNPSLENAALDYIGFGDLNGSDPMNRNIHAGLQHDCLALVKGDYVPSMHLLRGTHDGFLHDISLSSLTVMSHKVSQGGATLPGFFSDGSLRYLTDRFLNIIRYGRLVKIDRTGGVLFFGEDYIYKVPGYTGVHESENIVFRKMNGHTDPDFVKIDSDGRTETIKLPFISKKYPERSGDSIFSIDTAEDISKENLSFDIRPDMDALYIYSCDPKRDKNYVKKLSISDGNLVWSSATDYVMRGKLYGPTAKREGISAPLWHVFSECSGRYSGGSYYSIKAGRNSDEQEKVLVSGLSDLTDNLEMRVRGAGVIQLLYSCAGATQYSTFDQAGQLLNEWNFPPHLGHPLLLSERNLILIPKASGYEAYHVFGASTPERAFEIYFGGNSDYAIILPNGLYAGSPGCERLFTLKAGNGPVDPLALAPWRNRPAEVIKALGGDQGTAELLAKVTDRWLKRVGIDPSQPEPDATELPRVEVMQMPPLWAKTSSVSFPIEVTAGGAPLREVSVRVNGILQQRIQGGDLSVPAGSKGNVKADLTLAQGQNWIEVMTTDEKGIASNRAHFRTILREAELLPRRFVVAMGCSEYKRPELNLQYAAKDARDVMKALVEAGGRECKTLLLTNKDVTQSALGKIKDFVGESRESDEVILFCAGHGMLDERLDYIFAGHEVDPEAPGQTGIKLDALLDAVKAGKALKRLVLMDTCHSGSVGEQEEMMLAQASGALPDGVRAVKSRALKAVGAQSLSGAQQQRFIEELFLLPGQQRGINIIGASGGAEYAMESSQWKNGVFTLALIEGLREKKADLDNKGRVTVSDLKTYLAQRVMELTGGAQKPSVVAFERDQNFDLVGDLRPMPGGGKVPASKQPQALGTSAEKQEQETDANRAFSPEERDAGVVFKNGLLSRFRWCPHGGFVMGITTGEVPMAEKKWDCSDERKHLVTLTSGFWLAEHEVTQGEWRAVMGRSLRHEVVSMLNDQRRIDFGNGVVETLREHFDARVGDAPETLMGVESENMPIYWVNWEQASGYCQRLTEKERLAGRLPTGWKYALPTEAQWEYACRADTTGIYGGIESRFSSQETLERHVGEFAWHLGNSSVGYTGRGWDVGGKVAGPRSVGGRKANPWGLKDMIGNVAEWCADWYSRDIRESSLDPEGPALGNARVARGGSWNWELVFCRTAMRNKLNPAYRGFDVGFRPAIVPCN